MTDGIDKFGEKEYKKLLQEVDLMTHKPVDIDALINKWMKEIKEHMAAKDQEKEVSGEKTNKEPIRAKPGHQQL